jgi:ABC-2 type transport system permease protein
MNVRFSSLYVWEAHRALCSPLLWLLLALIAAAFLWGAQSTARMHRAQTDALERLALAESAATAQWQEQAARNAVRASEPLPYWQDATDVAGFSQYFLFRHSFKPHLPASVLAVGVSDLQPVYQRVRLTTPFGQDASYDFHSPRALTLGSFDLSFVIVCLLPIATILGFVLPVTFERDRGVMRLIAAQSTTPRQWLHARMFAILSVLLSGTGVAFVAALAFVGVSLAQAAPEIAASMSIVVAYILFWAAIVYAVLTRWPHGWTALGTLITVWTVLVIALPLLAGRIASASMPSVAADEVETRSIRGITRLGGARRPGRRDRLFDAVVVPDAGDRAPARAASSIGVATARAHHARFELVVVCSAAARRADVAREARRHGS